MRKDGRRSDNIEDRRGRRGGRAVAGLGGGAILLLVVAAWALGADPGEVLRAVEGAGGAGGGAGGGTVDPAQDELADFVSVVLADTEDTWTPLFREAGLSYEAPTLVLFTDSVDSACGRAGASVGPFYCPGDRQVYIDLAFFDDLDRRFGAPGDFAQAYVIGHEIGHHIQTITGVSARLREQERGMSEVERNALSVRQELQADCYAGVWAHHAHRQRNVLEPGDVEEGLRAAAAIGDDRLQRQARGRVSPESFTHGTSEQRVRWFRAGMQHGQMARCDTYSVERL